ncbi:MAG: hypothetical protein FWC91_13825 [Defluviitaleaceae bacterium]|nr:hypothetical protein [Defluviitaleaceae bacterium]
MSISLPCINVSYTSANCIKVEKNGIYQVHYSFVATSSDNVTITLAISTDNSQISQTTTTRLAKMDEEIEFTNTTIVSFHGGSDIELTISSDKNVNLTMGKGANATLILIKLN